MTIPTKLRRMFWASGFFAVCLVLVSICFPSSLVGQNCGIPGYTGSEQICAPANGGLGIVLASDSGDRRRSRQQKGEEGHSGNAFSVLGKCSSCHLEDPVLPEGHVATVEMPLAHCRTCHTPKRPMSLAGKMPLDHKHALVGFGCVACHSEEAPFEEPEMEVCLTCHGTLAQLAARTDPSLHANPHGSPHGAPYAECTLCHWQHEESEDYCATCHDFDFALP
ncbi:cytochrome c3 family protein [Thalassovita taeanensis]|uniref:Cytochrome c3 n=1 Tax=Thalassovita taeanensis TaxID=657014 RepID=A0A1H8ZF98_9RHOB|nr:cytochrome c3 family protein [Thalassovita taeanensis]SEP63052.1 Cytochrome c3 [Thalassovita taeanensis]